MLIELQHTAFFPWEEQESEGERKGEIEAWWGGRKDACKSFWLGNEAEDKGSRGRASPGNATIQ